MKRLLLQWLCRKARRDCACKDDVARLIALVTTMLRGSKRSGSQRRCLEAYCSRNDDVARLKEIKETRLTMKMSWGLLLSRWQCREACRDSAQGRWWWPQPKQQWQHTTIQQQHTPIQQQQQQQQQQQWQQYNNNMTTIWWQYDADRTTTRPWDTWKRRNDVELDMEKKKRGIHQ